MSPAGSATAALGELRRDHETRLIDPVRGGRDMRDAARIATYVAIDDALIEHALRIGGERTKKATVAEALREYIARREQERVVELFGSVDVDPRYDHKTRRRLR